MVMVLPMYEVEQAGVYYNTAAVIDADGTYLGKYRKHHIPQVKGFWEKFYFRPGNLGYPVFDTAVGKVGVYICYDRHFPEGWRALGLNGANIVFNPSATSRGLSAYLWKLEQPASAVANEYFIGAINRVGIEPLGENDFYGTSYFVDPEGKFVGDPADDHKPELIVRDLDIDLLKTVRDRWQFYRDRRPDALRRPGGTVSAERAMSTATTTLITGGQVISTTGAVPMDVLVDGETIAALYAPGTAAAQGVNADRTIDATGKYVVPGGIDVHTHMELPFGGTFASDTFETGTRAAAWGGTTTIVDFAVQTYGGNVIEALGAWHEKADGNCAIDYGFHLIIGGVDDDSLKAMDYLVENEGVTSFKLFMAYPGRLLQRRRPDPAGHAEGVRERRRDHDARRERHRHRRARRPGPRPGRDRPEVPRHRAPLGAGGRGHQPGHRARRRWPATCPLYIVHMSASEALEALAAARHGGANVFGETCPQYLYMTLEEHLAAPGLRGRQVRLLAADPHGSRPPPPGPVEGPAHQRARLRLDRPLPVLLQGAEGAGPRRLLQDPQRHRRRRAPDGPHLPGRRQRRAEPHPLDRDVRHDAGPHVRPLPEEGRHRPGLRRRHRDLRPQRPHRDRPRQEPPHEHGPLGLGGHGHRRQGRHRPVPRHGGHRERRVRRGARATGSSSSGGSAGT